MSHIFVSYARKDTRHAELVDRDLTAKGFRVWRDTRGIGENDDFTGAIERAIRDASHVIVCLTEDVHDRTNDSYVRREIQYALAQDKRRQREHPSRRLPVIPIVFPGGELPVSISTWKGIELSSDADWPHCLQELLARLTKSGSSTEEPHYEDPERIVEYLRALHERVSTEIEETVHTVVTLSASARPDAVSANASGILLKFSVSHAAAGNPGPTRRFGSFAEAFEHYRRRVLLLGAPGAGKTTTLLAAARHAAVARMTDARQPIPVLASIRNWDGRVPLRDWIATQAEGVDLSGQSLMYLLDGLDELPAERISNAGERSNPQTDFLDALEQQLTSEPVVVSARLADYLKIGKKAGLRGAVTLEPLSDVQIRTYLTTRGCPELWSALENDGALREMAQTPLLLALLRAPNNTAPRS